MSETDEAVNQRPFTPIEAKKVIGIAALGAVMGLLVWELAMVLSRYVLSAWMCHGAVGSTCDGAPQYAEAIASIVGGAVGLFFLVKLQVFRPLLVVIGVVAATWGIVTKAAPLPWYGIGLTAIFMYALAYVAFAWIARIKAFWLVLALMVVLVIVTRLLLSY